MKKNIGTKALILILVVLGISVIGSYLFSVFMGNMIGAEVPDTAKMLNNLLDDPQFSLIKNVGPLLWLTQHLHFILPGIFILIFLIGFLFKLKEDWSNIGKTEDTPSNLAENNGITKTFVNGQEVDSNTSLGDLVKEKLQEAQQSAAEQPDVHHPSTTFLNGQEINAEQLSDILGGNLTQAQKEALQNFGKK